MKIQKNSNGQIKIKAEMHSDMDVDGIYFVQNNRTKGKEVNSDS